VDPRHLHTSDFHKIQRAFFQVLLLTEPSTRKAKFPDIGWNKAHLRVDTLLYTAKVNRLLTSIISVTCQTMQFKAFLACEQDHGFCQPCHLQYETCYSIQSESYAYLQIDVLAVDVENEEAAGGHHLTCATGSDCPLHAPVS